MFLHLWNQLLVHCSNATKPVQFIPCLNFDFWSPKTFLIVLCLRRFEMVISQIQSEFASHFVVWCQQPFLLGGYSIRLTTAVYALIQDVWFDFAVGPLFLETSGFESIHLIILLNRQIQQVLVRGRWIHIRKDTSPTSNLETTATTLRDHDSQSATGLLLKSLIEKSKSMTLSLYRSWWSMMIILIIWFKIHIINQDIFLHIYTRTHRQSTNLHFHSTFPELVNCTTCWGFNVLQQGCKMAPT